VLILFDIDDTLLDDAGATNEAVRAFHTSLARDESLEAFRLRWRDSLDRHFTRYLARELSFQGQRRERIRDALQAELSDAEADRLFAGYLESYARSWRLFDDALPCLEKLAAFRLGIVSNGNPEQQRRKLERVGVLKRFSVVVGPDEAGVAKPNREIFLRACALAGVAPTDAVHVGDQRETDALAAVGAGLRSLWVNRGCAQRDCGDGVSCVRSLAEVPDIVHMWSRAGTVHP
jgi:putative hydrolase of the HAD superfamily